MEDGAEDAEMSSQAELRKKLRMEARRARRYFTHKELMLSLRRSRRVPFKMLLVRTKNDGSRSYGCVCHVAHDNEEDAEPEVGRILFCSERGYDDACILEKSDSDSGQ